MKRSVRPLRFQPVERFRPRLMYVNQRAPQQGIASEAGGPTPLPSISTDGYINPRPQDTLFDVIVRVPTLAVSATLTQNVFTIEDRIKGGWIRKLGYGFNNPHGFFQVRTFILVNGGVPDRYVFKTVDSSAAPSTYSGSLPPVQLGSIQNPADVFILLPSNALVQVQFVNASAEEVFTAVVRLWGWNFGN